MLQGMGMIEFMHCICIIRFDGQSIAYLMNKCWDDGVAMVCALHLYYKIYFTAKMIYWSYNTINAILSSGATFTNTV